VDLVLPFTSSFSAPACWRRRDSGGGKERVETRTMDVSEILTFSCSKLSCCVSSPGDAITELNHCVNECATLSAVPSSDPSESLRDIVRSLGPSSQSRQSHREPIDSNGSPFAAQRTWFDLSLQISRAKTGERREAQS